MKTSLATVIIPAYNAERFLNEAIQSILNQNYKSVEIIVVDDGSIDGTKQIVERYGEVQYIYQHNQGQAAAMNTGLKASKGEFVSFLDSDDILLPNKLSKHIDCLDRYGEVDIIISLAKNFKDPSFDGSHIFDTKTEELEAQLFTTATIRRKVFETVGDFNLQRKHAKEIDWLFRAKENGVVIKNDDSVVMLRRLHDTNMSYSVKEKTSDFMSAVRSSILRKKASEE